MLWLLAAVSIVTALAVYAAILVGRLLAQRRLIAQAVTQRNNKLEDDIRYIAVAMIEARCGLSEGAIRVCNLLPVLQTGQRIDWAQHYPNLYALYDKVKDLPTHEARNALPKLQLRLQDLQRKSDEEELAQAIENELAQLREFQLIRYTEE